MSKNLESQILEFVQNRYNNGESTASRHVHIRFDIEFSQAEDILEKLSNGGLITKSYDEDYQETRYSQKQ